MVVGFFIMTKLLFLLNDISRAQDAYVYLVRASRSETAEFVSWVPRGRRRVWIPELRTEPWRTPGRAQRVSSYAFRRCSVWASTGSTFPVRVLSVWSAWQWRRHSAPTPFARSQTLSSRGVLVSQCKHLSGNSSATKNEQDFEKVCRIHLLKQIGFLQQPPSISLNFSVTEWYLKRTDNSVRQKRAWYSFLQPRYFEELFLFGNIFLTFKL